MEFAIVTTTFALVGIIGAFGFFRLRRMARARGTLQVTPIQKLAVRFIPGAIIGSTLFQWFYFETGLKNTLLSSAPFSRQMADVIGIWAFTIFGFAVVEGGWRIFRLRNAGPLTPEPNRAPNG